MTVEVEAQDAEVTNEVVEEKKTDEVLSKELYKDDVKETETEEVKADADAEQETPEEEAKEEQEEQEETEVREDDVTLTLSKDSPLEKADLADLEDYAKDNKLNQADADNVLQYAEKQKADHNSLVEGWGKEIGDHEVYGKDIEKYSAYAMKALDKYGNEEARTKFEETGLGNYLPFFDTFVKIGQAMAEDKFIQGTPPKAAKASLANRMYSNDVKKE